MEKIMSYADAEPDDFPVVKGPLDCDLEQEPLDLVLDELDLSELDDPVDKLTDKIQDRLVTIRSQIRESQRALKSQRERLKRYEYALTVIRAER